MERLCLDRDVKMTGQRRTIARVLSEAVDYPDVEQVYARARALDAHISIATVYRLVRLLEEREIVQRRHFGGSRARYEAGDGGPLCHVIDVDTGEVTAFLAPDHDALVKAALDRLGWELMSCRLQLFARRRPDRD